MNYILLIVFFLLLCLIVNVISPFIRNVLKLKNNFPLENNLGGKLVKFFYKKNRGLAHHSIFIRNFYSLYSFINSIIQQYIKKSIGGLYGKKNS